jgi:ribonuclease HII
MLPHYYLHKSLEAGCDEAGRGCMAGPVFAAAVILSTKGQHELLNDSKKITKANRYELRTFIEKNAICFAVAKISAAEIDEINILQASIKAMHLALDGLKKIPKHIIVDGNKFLPYKNITHNTIIKGDGKYANIAAASILAKTYRDDYMIALHIKNPHYGWNSNKGYGTVKHKTAMEKFGLTEEHRKTFTFKADLTI